MSNKALGFTLVELMVAAAIIGILASIAIPNFTNMKASSRRQDGVADLYRVMNQQERYFLNNSVYTLNLGRGGIGYATNGDGSLTSPEEYYKISGGNCQTINGNMLFNVTNCIRLVATPEREDDPEFWLQSDGQKSELMP